MIKYTGHYITFQEVPNEVSLVQTISECGRRCEGCHSPWLRESIGEDLKENLPELLAKYYKGITCVCFMGEGQDDNDLLECVRLAKSYGLKTCLYSGANSIQSASPVALYVDYIKIGSYQKDKGGLDSATTNQRMFFYDFWGDGCYHDITHLFQKKNVK